MLENNYYYELKYVYKDKVVTVKFSGETNFDNLVENLQSFLASAGWREDTIKEQIKTEADIWEEAEQKQKELKEKDNSERKDLKPEYYDTRINEGEFKNNVNYYGNNNYYDFDNNYCHNYNYYDTDG